MEDTGCRVELDILVDHTGQKSAVHCKAEGWGVDCTRTLLVGHIADSVVGVDIVPVVDYLVGRAESEDLFQDAVGVQVGAERN